MASALTLLQVLHSMERVWNSPQLAVRATSHPATASGTNEGEDGWMREQGEWWAAVSALCRMGDMRTVAVWKVIATYRRVCVMKKIWGQMKVAAPPVRCSIETNCSFRVAHKQMFVLNNQNISEAQGWKHYATSNFIPDSFNPTLAQLSHGGCQQAA